jgi:hypothetical protein
MTDAAAPVPGLTVISDYYGPLPMGNVLDDEIPQMPGFPITIGGAGNFAPTRSVVFADLNGDRNLEIITGSTDNRVYAWDYTGASMPGFPVETIDMGQTAPSVADLDGDGDLEIVQFTRFLNSGHIYIIDHLGNVLPGFPLNINNNMFAGSPTLYDLDNDGVMEIIAGERDWPIGYLHVIELDGTRWGGNWPILLDHVPTGSAAVGDVDNDGDVEIFYTSFVSMYLFELDGTLLRGWPKQIRDATFSYASAALADLDDDGDLEIVVGAHGDAPGCYVFHHDGRSLPGWPNPVTSWTYCPPTVTDLEGDGELEILFGRGGSGAGDAFWAWDTRGYTKPGFPYRAPYNGGSDGPLTVADIDGDGLMEIFADCNLTEVATEQGWLFGVDSLGNDLPGFPLRPHGSTYMRGATIGDVDGDGDYELGVVSRDESGVYVNLYDLPDSYRRTSRDWKIYHARNRRGGLYPAVVPCPADLNGDGVIDLADLGILLADFGCVAPGPCPGDIDGDGDTDLADLGVLLAEFGTSCP